MSPYASPLFFVPKPDGSSQPVFDCRWVNSYTIRDKYPLPRIDDIIDRLQGSDLFTKMDVRWGFKNICIHDGDQWKATFLTEFGLFKPLVMYFGLCNSLPTFQ